MTCEHNTTRGFSYISYYLRPVVLIEKVGGVCFRSAPSLCFVLCYFSNRNRSGWRGLKGSTSFPSIVIESRPTFTVAFTFLAI